MITLSINRSVEARTWALQDAYRPLAYLQLARFGADSGEVRRDDEVWQISFSGRLSRSRAVLGTGDRTEPLLGKLWRERESLCAGHNSQLADPALGGLVWGGWMRSVAISDASHPTSIRRMPAL